MRFTHMLALVALLAVVAGTYLYTQPHMQTPIRFIPIGDSYTIGESVGETERWPNLLTRHLSDAGTPTELIANPGQTGWTTRTAIERELPVVEKERPNLITILIGVNDLVQGVPGETFQKNLEEIVDRSTAALTQPGTLVLITIPDFTLTPAGKSFSSVSENQKTLAVFNNIIRQEAEKRGLPIADIHAVSVRLGEDPTYTANDGLHPSPSAYIEWEKEIFSSIPRP